MIVSNQYCVNAAKPSLVLCFAASGRTGLGRFLAGPFELAGVGRESGVGGALEDPDETEGPDEDAPDGTASPGPEPHADSPRPNTTTAASPAERNARRKGQRKTKRKAKRTER
ncbi:hypothetical protein [Sinomonas sp. P47F7]|uniref:hypothetical protein n=1 Tax=Sinomonas sp. P47F7 TaxID=3410987 RepID=UPI003BF4937B